MGRWDGNWCVFSCHRWTLTRIECGYLPTRGPRRFAGVGGACWWLMPLPCGSVFFILLLFICCFATLFLACHDRCGWVLVLSFCCSRCSLQSCSNISEFLVTFSPLGVTNVVGEIPIVLHGVVCAGPDYVLLILHIAIALRAYCYINVGGFSFQ